MHNNDNCLDCLEAEKTEEKLEKAVEALRWIAVGDIMGIYSVSNHSMAERARQVLKELGY